MSTAPTSLTYCHDKRTLFVGVESGAVEEWEVARDYNRMDTVRTYHAHQGRVTDTVFAESSAWILTTGRDKNFYFHCTQTGKRLGGYMCNAWCTSLAYDKDAQYVFVGDYSGAISVLHVTQNGVTFINTLKGHSGSIQCLAWDGDRNWLYSGSYDTSVFVWDIGGRRGTVYELHGHRSKVSSLIYSPQHKRLLSVGEDSRLVCWDMDQRRIETPDWAESDICQLCSRPFFWNVKAMYEQKQVGLRQHHCRRCGKAVCDYCSSKRSVLTDRGHEYPVRVCENCFIDVKEGEKKPLANFFDTRQVVKHLFYDSSRSLLGTVGHDNVIKLWQVKDILEAGRMSGP